jgi:hypothetical protein
MAFLQTVNYPRAPNISLFAQSSYGIAPSKWAPLQTRYERPFATFVNASKGFADPASGTFLIPIKPLPGTGGGGGPVTVGYAT